jgi:glycosyltransferase involved in cell wall biosynthesis
MNKIVYIGQFNDAAGYASAARSLLKTLAKDGVTPKTLKILPLNFENRNFASAEETKLINSYALSENDPFLQGDYKVLYHLCPHLINVSSTSERILKNSKENINMVYWEADKIPEPWLKTYKTGLFKKIIVACHWNREVFEKETGIPTYIYRPSMEINKTGAGKQEIFRIFSMSQWIYKKGFDILIKAYCQEFFDNTDTELFIKTYRHETLKGAKSETEKNIILQEAKQYKNSIFNYSKNPSCKIAIKTGYVDEREIQEYYEKSSIFCLPTRGEGFGLTIAQAALSGLPCLVPDLGGQKDLVDPALNTLINSRMEYVSNLNGLYGKDMKHVEADISSLREKMRYFYNLWKNDREALENIGQETKKYTKKLLDEKYNLNSLLKALYV